MHPRHPRQCLGPLGTALGPKNALPAPPSPPQRCRANAGSWAPLCRPLLGLSLGVTHQHIYRGMVVKGEGQQKPQQHTAAAPSLAVRAVPPPHTWWRLLGSWAPLCRPLTASSLTVPGGIIRKPQAAGKQLQGPAQSYAGIAAALESCVASGSASETAACLRI